MTGGLTLDFGGYFRTKNDLDESSVLKEHAHTVCHATPPKIFAVMKGFSFTAETFFSRMFST